MLMADLNSSSDWLPDDQDTLRTIQHQGVSYQASAKAREYPQGAAMKVIVSDQVHLSEFRSSDKEALILHLNDREIYDRTLRIPFPYTEAAADEWLALYAKTTEQLGRPVNFAIRST